MQTMTFCKILKMTIYYPQCTDSRIISQYISYYCKEHVSAVFFRCFNFESSECWEWSINGNIQNCKIISDCMVTMVIAHIRNLWNAHQKIPHKIWEKSWNFGFWLVILKKTWVCPPRLDRAKITPKQSSRTLPHPSHSSYPVTSFLQYFVSSKLKCLTH